MRHVRGFITTSEALQQVFEIPVNLSRPPISDPGSRWRTTCFSRRHFSISNPCAATYIPPFGQINGPTRRRDIDPAKYGPQSPVERPPRDEEISARQVVTRLPNGRLSEVRTLREILDERMRDEKGKYSQYVQVVAEPDRILNRPYPVVAYFGKKESKERELAAKKREKDFAVREKSIELSWSIGDNDLKHRMEKMQEFLQKGKKVEVLFGSKGWRVSKRKISEDEALSLLGKIRSAALQVNGVQMMREFKGILLREGNMMFQGPLKTSKETNVVDVDQSEETSD